MGGNMKRLATALLLILLLSCGCPLITPSVPVMIRNVGKEPVQVAGGISPARLEDSGPNVEYWKEIPPGEEVSLRMYVKFAPFPKYVRIYVAEEGEVVTVYETVYETPFPNYKPRSPRHGSSLFKVFGKPDCPMWPDPVEVNTDDPLDRRDLTIRSGFSMRVELFRDAFWFGYLLPGETYTFKMIIPLAAEPAPVRLRAVEFTGTPGAGSWDHKVLFDRRFTIGDLSKAGWYIEIEGEEGQANAE